MHPNRRPVVRRTGPRGFSLMESLVAVALTAILGGIALPSFQDSVRKARRSDALAGLMFVQQAQERHRTRLPTYAGALTSAPDADPPGLGLSGSNTPAGHYSLTLQAASASGYTVIATARDDQARDRACRLMGVRVLWGQARYGGGGESIDFDAVNPDPGRCWPR